MRCAGWCFCPGGSYVNVRDSPDRSGSLSRCRNRATTAIGVGCLHEHVRHYGLCASCAERVIAQVSEGKAARCLACLPDHQCPVMIAADDGALASLAASR